MSETVKRGRGRPRKVLDMEKVAQCIRLRFSDRAIAKELGMSHANWMRRKHQKDIEEVRREVAAAAPLAMMLKRSALIEPGSLVSST